MSNYYDYLEGGFRIFSLWGANPDGSCQCGREDCEAILKHPRISNWQHSPHWSDEQIEIMESTGQFDTGFGVCLDNHLVIDIDPRNGGFEGYDKLKKDTGIDYEEESSFVVSTGGGGLHIYFNAPEGVSLVSHLKDYKGIDFKNSGFVVGSGSLHASGMEYERKKGFPQDLTSAPQKIIDLLKKPDRVRAHVGSDFVDVSEAEIRTMLDHISPDCDYDQWVQVGMGLHEATQGSGVHIWDDWSAKGEKYNADNIDKHWQSFGKCANPVTLGTIIHLAEQGGWTQPVTFDLAEEKIEETRPVSGLPFDVDSVDLLRPPGFVGEVTNWINAQCRFPRERLAVATALNVIGNIGGLRHKDDYNGITANTLMLCVAGSGTGKEAVQQAESELMRAAGISAAVHGAIKSEQEITRNIVRHQAAYYVIDELGYLLQKIENARKRGGATYLDGVIGSIMSIYTKANGYYLVGGDLKEDIRSELLKELVFCEKKMQENEDPNGRYEKKAKILRERTIPSIDDGLERPFLSMIGYTTPVSFDDLVTGEQATNGFIGRCLLVREHETNPKRKRGFKPTPLSDQMRATLQMVYQLGTSPHEKDERIEWYGEQVNVPTTEKAQNMLEDAADWFEEEAERQKSITGLEAIIRRGYELMAKISFILAIPGRIREAEHVRWAFAMVRQDLREKLRLAQTNILNGSANSDDAGTVLRNKILDSTGEDGEVISVIKRRVGRKFNPEDIEKMVSKMVEGGLLSEVEKKTRNGKSIRYVSNR